MLEPEKCYHIYNRANGHENLFENEGNYHFFLNRYKNFIDPITNTFCYCLMPNHFHFFIRVKSFDEIILAYKELKMNVENRNSSKVLNFGRDINTINRFISKQFANLFSSHTQAFNKQQNRTGSLFQKNFKRKEVESIRNFQHLVQYIHCNPVHHGFCDSHEDWLFSSYNSIVSNFETSVSRNEVISWFDTVDNFKFCHDEKLNALNINNLILE